MVFSLGPVVWNTTLSIIFIIEGFVCISVTFLLLCKTPWPRQRIEARVYLGFTVLQGEEYITIVSRRHGTGAAAESPGPIHK